jgi:hypothetical protein
MRQLRPPPVRSGAGAKKLHAKAAAEKHQSITLVNQSFDERKIVVLRSDASDKTAKQSEAGYPRVDTIFVNTSAFIGSNPPTRRHYFRLARDTPAIVKKGDWVPTSHNRASGSEVLLTERSKTW